MSTQERDSGGEPPRYEDIVDDNSSRVVLVGKPRDRYKLVCIGFAILGMTSLVPWNFFITATDVSMHTTSLCFREIKLTVDI